MLGEWGHIDVLVNNAVHTGAGSMDHFLDLSVELLETKLEANVVAQFVLAKLVIPSMLERGDGTIVNITSAVATTDPPAPAGQGGWGMGYAMSKGAFHRMAGILAVELGPRGIRAFNVEPGYVLTERMAVNQAELGFEGVYRGAPAVGAGGGRDVAGVRARRRGRRVERDDRERAAVRARAGPAPGLAVETRGAERYPSSSQTQNSLPSMSVITCQRLPHSSNGVPAARAPSASSRATSSAMTGTCRSRWRRFLPALGSGTCWSTRRGAGPRGGPSTTYCASAKSRS